MAAGVNHAWGVRLVWLVRLVLRVLELRLLLLLLLGDYGRGTLGHLLLLEGNLLLHLVVGSGRHEVRLHLHPIVVVLLLLFGHHLALNVSLLYPTDRGSTSVVRGPTSTTSIWVIILQLLKLSSLLR